MRLFNAGASDRPRAAKTGELKERSCAPYSLRAQILVFALVTHGAILGRVRWLERPTDEALMPKLDDQISTLEERLKQLKLRAQRIEARKKSIDAKRERKADTRRKILVGAIVMAKVEQQVMDEKLLRGWLEEALTRSDDRALFKLPKR
jgi:hypothetical protein